MKLTEELFYAKCFPSQGTAPFLQLNTSEILSKFIFLNDPPDPYYLHIFNLFSPTNQLL